MKLLEAILFLTVVTLIYSWVMSKVASMIKNNEKYLKDEPTWMTVVVPSIGKGSESDDSDESAGLLSLKGWNYYKSELSYQSIDSDLSDESDG